METEHTYYIGNSQELTEIDSDSVELVVTSPPYPMIEMWDEVFGEMNEVIKASLDEGNGQYAFELMHNELEKVWEEVERVLVDGGIACINIGDATRKLGDSFRVYQNHSRVIDKFTELGFEPLPEILWRKPTNSASKFMGSGMLPPNAYVTLEHEYILIFRNGKESRTFEPHADRRYEASYFWEERNEWFSDVWENITGKNQKLENDEVRERSAAYPFEIPYRLINMYSVYNDTVFDPFWGTGTTSVAAMVAGRNSIGYELEANFATVFENRIENISNFSESTILNRINSHRKFVQEKTQSGKDLKYEAENYDFLVTTKQEKPIQFKIIQSVERDESSYSVKHVPFYK